MSGHWGGIWLGLGYLLVAGLWILYSDHLVRSLASDAAQFEQLRIYKDWLPVAGTAMLLYVLFKRRVQPPLGEHAAVADGDRRVRILVIAFSLLFVGAVLVNLVFALMQARERILAEHADAAQKLAQVLEEQTAGSIRAIEIALHATTRSMQLMPGQGPSYRRIVHELLQDDIRNLPFVRAIWVLDANGNMIHDSESLSGSYNLAEREYFRVHRDNPSYGLYIDRPILSKLGVWFIGVSRRIANPDGSFGGVIVAALEPDYLLQFYQSIKVGKEGVVALMELDGTLMLRVPTMERVRGKKLKPLPGFVERLPYANAGSYRTTSSVDGVERIYFYRRVAGRPLVILIGLGATESLSAWRSIAYSYIAVSLAFLLVIGWLSYLALYELRRRTVLNQALREGEAALATAQRLSRVGSWQLDLASKTGSWSREMYHLFGLAPAASPPPLTEFLTLLHPDDRAQIETAVRDGDIWSGELRSNPAHGPVRFYSAHCSAALRDAAGRATVLAGTLQDITERRQSVEKQRLAARVFEHTRDGIIITDAGNNIVAVNAAFERITGYGEAEVLGRNPRMLQALDRHDAAFYHALWQDLLAHGQWRGEIWNRRKNGEVYPQWLVISSIRNDQQECTGYVGVFTDLSEIKEANEQLAFLINHDPLTRLPNRSLLNDRLQQAIDAARSEERQVALLLLNIDRLQRVNDSIGHDAGDALLCEMAQRLHANLRPGDTLARLGSDEFVVVLTQFEDTDDIIAAARQLLTAVTAPCVLYGHELSVTASIGITIYPGDASNPGDLLKGADTALSHVKSAGRNGFRFFTAEMNARALHWMSLDQRLRGALARNELSLHYQPQVCLDDGRICGVEALIRWNNAELGMISPADFIPLAEDTGLIVAIGEWVIRHACSQNQAWQDAGLPPVPIAVNVSAHQITTGTLPEVIRSVLQQTGLAAQYLEVELTESVLIRETEVALQQIAELRRMGLAVSLDDFGTGYSSLGYLSRFTLDKLKIDQCFVRDITHDPKSAAIAHATIALAHGLGITVIAEGVETEEQLAYLRNAGCDEIQGFVVSQPVPAVELAALLKQGKVLPSNGKIDTETGRSQIWQ